MKISDRDVETILITGATGNVGSETLAALMGAIDGGNFEIRAAVRNPDGAPSLPSGVAPVQLDFTHPERFAACLSGVDRLLLVRPPTLANVKRYFVPFIRAAETAGVRHVVFLSVMGVENAGFIPHAKIERALRESRLSWTFLRPGFFNQNLSSTHAADIRRDNRVFVPAGDGATNFVDTRDIAAVAAKVLTETGHEGSAYTLTSDDTLTYEEVARILSQELDREIVYERPGALRFIMKELRQGTPLSFALLMTGIYLPTRLGKVSSPTETIRALLGRDPISFRRFVQEHRQVWMDN